MPAKGLVCARCSHRYPLEQLYKCGQCGGILEVEYQYEVVAEADAQPEALDASNDRELTAWLLESFLPVEQAKRVGLGEGDTPLVSVPRLSRSVGVPRLWLKCESGNPTGSFKDRPVSIGVSKAGELGISTAVVASSGNASSSAAAFAARAGMRAVVLIPKTASAEKVAQTRRHGALVLQIDGSISTCFELARRLSEEHGFCNLSTTFVNPYTVEGNKTISYELFMQMNREVPDVIFVPVGAGPMLVGMLRGYLDLERAGLCRRLPRMVGVQAQGCDPIVQAHEKGERSVHSCEHPHTIADGVADGLVGYEDDGTHTLSYIHRSGGWALSVSDEEIREAQRNLAELEGILAEATGAVGLAGVAAARRRGMVDESATIVTIVSGHGLKDATGAAQTAPAVVPPRVEAILEKLANWR